MARKLVPDRGQMHTPALDSVVDVVKYRLQAPPVKSGLNKKKKATAWVVPKASLTLGDVAQEVNRRFPNLQPATVEYMVEALAEVLCDKLRAGHPISIGGLFSLGVSLKGTVDPERPLDARFLTLTPWARFSQRFITTLNRGAKLAHDGE